MLRNGGSSAIILFEVLDSSSTKSAFRCCLCLMWCILCCWTPEVLGLGPLGPISPMGPIGAMVICPLDPLSSGSSGSCTLELAQPAAQPISTADSEIPKKQFWTATAAKKISPQFLQQKRRNHYRPSDLHRLGLPKVFWTNSLSCKFRLQNAHRGCSVRHN